MLKYWRLWLLVVMVLASVFAIGLKAFPYGREGVRIVYIAGDSPAKGVLEDGMTITQLNGQSIRSVDDWNKNVGALTGTVTLRANGKDVNVAVNKSIGVNVIGIERTNIDFGLDIKGGTRIILQPDGNATDDIIDQTISVLETRANLFGLREIKFFPVKDIGGDYFVQIEAAGVGSEIVDDLLSRQGKFEAKVIKPVDITNQSGVLQLGEKEFKVNVLNDGAIDVNGSLVKVNETVVVNGIEFEYMNKTQQRVFLRASVFDGEDIELVYTDPQRSGVIPQGNFYQFYFQVLISAEGAARFADVTAGIPKHFDVNSGEEYLEEPLDLYLDNQLESSLRIAGSLAGQIVQSPQVTGSGEDLKEATQERLRLQTILKSGALPVSLSVLSADVISPTLGSGFFDSALQAIVMSAVIVLSIVFIRYRSLKIALPMVMIGMSEALIIVGIAATNDVGIWTAALFVNIALVFAAWAKKHEIDIYAWAGAVLIPFLGMMSWTIDLPAIAGIIAVIGTGVDHQIIIADESLKGKKKIFGIKEQLKMAFFIIAGAASTTIFAMMPLLFVGVGLIRGFAITTIAGVLVGILITRPAYARIMERLV